MLRELATHASIFAVPLGALFLFLTVFVGNFVRVYGRRASAYDPIARLPLDEINEEFEK
jgi:hypothetical protein